MCLLTFGEINQIKYVEFFGFRRVRWLPQNLRMEPTVRRISAVDNRILIGVIADAETTIGFLLAGIGETHEHNSNFMIVTDETPVQAVQQFFTELYNRRNIGVILIATDILRSLTQAMSRANRMIPIILEIPSKKSTSEIKN